jgi:hypothetical protein
MPAQQLAASLRSARWAQLLPAQGGSLPGVLPAHGNHVCAQLLVLFWGGADPQGQWTSQDEILEYGPHRDAKIGARTSAEQQYCCWPTATPGWSALTAPLTSQRPWREPKMPSWSHDAGQPLSARSRCMRLPKLPPVQQLHTGLDADG